MNNSKIVKQLKLFRWISLLEGISFVVLVFFAMPLKYIAGLPEFVKFFGMVHGVLFLAYIFQLLYIASFKIWSFKIIFIYGMASLLPFAPFWVERKVKRSIETDFSL